MHFVDDEHLGTNVAEAWLSRRQRSAAAVYGCTFRQLLATYNAFRPEFFEDVDYQLTPLGSVLSFRAFSTSARCSRTAAKIARSLIKMLLFLPSIFKTERCSPWAIRG
jgi:hypothetical protein